MEIDRDKLRCLIFDIDGTIINDEKTVSPNLCRWLATTARTSQLRIILASSRSEQSLAHIASTLEIDCGFVCYDGGRVLDERRSLIFEAFLQLCDAAGLFEASRRMGLTYSVFDREGWFASDGGYWTQREIRGTGVTPQILPHTEMDRRLVAGSGVYKLMFRGDADAVASFAALDEIATVSGLNTCYSNRPTIFEILSSEIDKFAACRLLLERWSLATDEVLFFGDGINDLGCMKNFPHSVAMANGTDEVKRFARYLTQSNSEEGVFSFLATLFRP
jgi:hypothetical protein